MKFYFSGVGRPKRGESLSAEFLMLRRAQVSYILVDQFQLPWIGDFRKGVGLDCGSYYAFKKCVVLELEPYLDIARTQGPFDFSSALDAVGNAELSHAYWQATKRSSSGIPSGMIPVWQWQAPREQLAEYMAENRVVGIGGLALLMREKNEAMRRELIEICAQYPQRAHVFGLNWLRCFNDLKDLIHSADSSKWLDAARKGTVIFHHTGNNHLAQMPERFAIQCGLIPRALTREERCVLSARNIEIYCNRDGKTDTFNALDFLPEAIGQQQANSQTERA